MIKWINVIISLGEKLQQLDLYVHCIIARGIVSYETKRMRTNTIHISKRSLCLEVVDTIHLMADGLTKQFTKNTDAFRE